jgi:ssDNA-binding Zn-finger/Zn-ribbon topoisomerase 1
MRAIWQGWQRCEHGVAGGEVEARGRCPLCKQKRIEVLERARRLEKERQETEARRPIYEEEYRLRRGEAVRLSKSMIPSLRELQKISPYVFEDRIAEMFKRLGFEVEQTAYSGDCGRDGILKKQGKKYLYECKRYGDNTKVGRPEIQKLHSAMVFDGAETGYFVSTGSFTKEAADYASSCKIELIDGSALLKRLVESYPPVSDGDVYLSICRQCGERVRHRLRTPEDVLCSKGHVVAPSLNIDEVIFDPEGVRPFCLLCDSVMVKRIGPRDPFWGCRNYPSCSYIRPVGWKEWVTLQSTWPKRKRKRRWRRY